MAVISWIVTELVPEITRATQDQSLVQEGLSKRLANRGILPMFGFPTRTRLLYHKQPSSWLSVIRWTVTSEACDRMFRPRCGKSQGANDTYAIGVAYYRRRGPLAEEDANPLGPPVRISLWELSDMWRQPFCKTNQLSGLF